jgi:pimeloyl-ACP methyl ester carboxylesterase
MQQAIPDAKLVVVPDATHGLPIEKPDVVGGIVRDFLRRSN